MADYADGFHPPLEPILRTRTAALRLQTITGMSFYDAQDTIDHPRRAHLEFTDLITAPARLEWLDANPDETWGHCLFDQHVWPFDWYGAVAQCLVCGCYLEASGYANRDHTRIDEDRFMHLAAAHHLFSPWAPPTNELRGSMTQREWLEERRHERDQLHAEGQLRRPAPDPW